MSAAAPPTTALAGSAEASLPREQTWEKRRSLPVHKYLALLIPGGVLALIVILTLLAPVIGVYVLLAGTLFIIVNLLTDVSYALLDPRVRLDGNGRSH